MYKELMLTIIATALLFYLRFMRGMDYALKALIFALFIYGIRYGIKYFKNKNKGENYDTKNS